MPIWPSAAAVAPFPAQAGLFQRQATFNAIPIFTGTNHRYKTMNFQNLSIPERLIFIKDVIAIIISNESLASTFASVGYTEQELARAQGLEEAARSYWVTQQVEYATRLASTGLLTRLYREMLARYRDDRKMVRIALDDQPGMLEKLRVSGPVPRKRSNVLLQVFHFYSEALNQAELEPVLSGIGLTPEVLQERLAAFTVVNEAAQGKKQQTGQAITITGERRAAMEAVDKWGVKFINIAKAVLKDDPGQLRKLGIE